MKYISVYVNGVFYEEADDYTFDNRTGVFVFANKFNADEKVTITVAYIDNISGNIDNTYENAYEKVKYYDNFSNEIPTIDFDIEKFNSFVLDFTKDNSIEPTTPRSIHIPNTPDINGKSIMVTLLFGSVIPIIAWDDTVIWTENSSPVFNANTTYYISMIQPYNKLKYMANLLYTLPTQTVKR